MAEIVVLGGGFAGLYTTRSLAAALADRGGDRITLIDANNYHLFSPMLHEVTAGTVEPRHVVWPIRRLTAPWGITFLQRRVEGVDLKGRRVHTDRGPVPFDVLVLGLGGTTNTFGIPGIAERAFPFKTLRDAVRLRNHLIRNFEAAEQDGDPRRRRELLTFVLVGGGCTAVELATELHDLARGTLLKYYPGLTRDEVRVVVLEATRRIIPCVGDRLAERALERLRLKDLEVRLEAPVADVTPGGAILASGEKIPSATVVWAAGVRASPVVEGLGAEHDGLGRVCVGETLEVLGHDGVFALGDCARFVDEAGGVVLPPTAQVAVQQAQAAAGNVARRLTGRSPLAFRYRHRGDIVSLGYHDAVGEIAGLQVSGPWVWFLWRTVFLGKLIGLKNRVRVALDWTIASFAERDTSALDWS